MRNSEKSVVERTGERVNFRFVHLIILFACEFVKLVSLIEKFQAVYCIRRSACFAAKASKCLPDCLLGSLEQFTKTTNKCLLIVFSVLVVLPDCLLDCLGVLILVGFI